MKLLTEKKILVTGGAGFIGSHLCDALRKENEVVSIDNYLSGKDTNHIEGVNYIKGSCKDIFKIVEGFSPDLIYHFGEYSRVESSFDDYDQVFDNNIISFKTILNFAKQNRSKLIYAGSSTKFASYENENDLSPYAWVKAKNTEHLINFSNWFGLDYAIVYFYNVYGGNEIEEGKFSTVIGKYKRLYLQGKRKLPLVKPGSQVRNFTHFSDVIRALILIGLKGKGDGYGIGADDAISMLELVKLLNCDPEYLPARRGNRSKASLNTSKTKDLGWEPEINIEDHIKNFLKSN